MSNSKTAQNTVFASNIGIFLCLHLLGTQLINEKQVWAGITRTLSLQLR